MSASAAAKLERLEFRRAFGWVGIFVFSAFLMAYVGYAVNTISYEHTYVKSSPPGILYTQRGDIYNWFGGFTLLAFFIPLTAALVVGAPPLKEDRNGDVVPAGTARRVFHLIVVVLLFLFFMTVFGVKLNDYLKANLDTAGNARNRANDDRWCCVHHMTAPSVCPNTIDCTPGVGIADLVINPLFLYDFYMLVVLIILICLDFIYAIWGYQKALLEYQEIILRRGGEAEPLLPNAPPQDMLRRIATRQQQQQQHFSNYKSRK